MLRWMPLLLLAACAPRMAHIAEPPEPVEIVYETGACFGSCPVYKVTVHNFGLPNTFEGQRFTAVTGSREFALSYAQFQAFAQALDEARMADPKAYQPGGANCRLAATDHSSVAVTFRIGQSAPWTFRFDYGCRDPQNAKLAESLRRAPELLPIAAFIGDRKRFAGQR